MILNYSEVADKIILDDQEWIKSAKGPIVLKKNLKFKKLFTEEEQEWIINNLVSIEI